MRGSKGKNEQALVDAAASVIYYVSHINYLGTSRKSLKYFYRMILFQGEHLKGKSNKNNIVKVKRCN